MRAFEIANALFIVPYEMRYQTISTYFHHTMFIHILWHFSPLKLKIYFVMISSILIKIVNVIFLMSVINFI